MDLGSYNCIGNMNCLKSSIKQVFPGGSVVKNPPANAGDIGDAGLIPGSERSPGSGNGNPLQYSCLENSMDRGAWQATVHGVKMSWTRLSIHTGTGQKQLTRIWRGNTEDVGDQFKDPSDSQQCCSLIATELYQFLVMLIQNKKILKL